MAVESRLARDARANGGRVVVAPLATFFYLYTRLVAFL